MGDITELILEGVLCQECGGLMEDIEEDFGGPGYPQTCEECR